MRVTCVQVTNWKSFALGELDLSNINVIIGKNNTGKSALLRAVQLMQQGHTIQPGDIRLGTADAEVKLTLAGPELPRDINRHYGPNQNILVASGADAVLGIRIATNDNGLINASWTLTMPENQYGVEPIRAEEPTNFIYNYLSKRKVTEFERVIDRARTLAVSQDLRFLVAKIDRLSDSDNVGAPEYAELCRKVLGLRIGTYASDGGHQAGISVGRYDHIPIEDMGEGVSSQVGLIADLCMADQALFLIEEPENDVHPDSLKALLDVIVEKSANNQFIVTTHSHIVARYLGGAADCKLFSVDSDFTPGAIPTSTVRELEPTPEARIEVLRTLGHELYDFDLWEGWLILEESSAERIIRDYLIPWYLPRLKRIRPIAARGTSKVKPLFEDFRRLFLYAHLERIYMGRAWVVVDGDDAGRKIVEQLRKTYATDWSSDHFTTWEKSNFEAYLPARFETDILSITDLSHDATPPAKKKLYEKVAAWCDSDPTARTEFETSAAEVIELLRRIDAKLFD